MYSGLFDLDAAFSHVRLCRSIINPNLGFVLSLETFAEQLRNGATPYVPRAPPPSFPLFFCVLSNQRKKKPSGDFVVQNPSSDR